MSRVLIVGAGSIGSRRARLLAEMGHEVGIADTFSDHRISVTQNLLERGYSVWPETTGPTSYYDAALICTPAKDHVRMARECVEGGIKGLFIEKPLSISMDGIPELIAECDARGVVTMGACNMRWAYPPFAAGLNLILTNTSPLGEWRPGATASYGRNGIILESAIHEMDLAAHWCGPIEGIATQGDGDSALIFTEHPNYETVQIRVDWRATATSERSVTWRNVNARLHRPADTSDKMYCCEMEYFLDHVASGTATSNPIANAAVTLGWALKARDMTRTVAA